MIWMAVALAGVALVIGVPIGWIVGRTLWRTLMHQLGLASAVSTHWVVWVLVPAVDARGRRVRGLRSGATSHRGTAR